MKLLFDFLPIIVFFVVFKFFGIYVATGAAIIVSVLQVASHWFKYRNVQSLQLISLILIVVFGGSTLLLHDVMFIKWKPTVLNWVLALAFIGSRFTSKTIIQRLMESNINLPQTVWRQLNMAWVVFFTLMGIINLWVAYHFDTNTWVNFKLFGMLGLTLIFAILQAIYLARHMPPPNEKTL
jgi:intracellular septation protein